MQGVIILGSSRNDVDTAAVTKKLATLTDFEVLDLNCNEFIDYDYQSRNSGDDFLPTVRRIVTDFDHIIWLTPVYWYSMSAKEALYRSHI